MPTTRLGTVGAERPPAPQPVSSSGKKRTLGAPPCLGLLDGPAPFLAVGALRQRQRDTEDEEDAVTVLELIERLEEWHPEVDVEVCVFGGTKKWGQVRQIVKSHQRPTASGRLFVGMPDRGRGRY